MGQFYSDPSRKDASIYAIPDAEAFEVSEGEMTDEEGEPMPAGWYYWHCFPGCMPEGPPMGPYDSEAKAIEACREECS